MISPFVTKKDTQGNSGSNFSDLTCLKLRTQLTTTTSTLSDYYVSKQSHATKINAFHTNTASHSLIEFKPEENRICICMADDKINADVCIARKCIAKKIFFLNVYVLKKLSGR